jgi:hypothetical protein
MTSITAMTHKLTLNNNKLTLDSGAEQSRNHSPDAAAHFTHFDTETLRISNRVNRPSGAKSIDLRNLYVPLDLLSPRIPPSHRVGQVFEEMPQDSYENAINLLRYRLYQSRRLLKEFSQTVEFTESDRRALSRAYDKLMHANGHVIKGALPMGIDILAIEEIKQAVNVKFSLQEKLLA